MTWTDAELQEFDRITMRLSSLRQMDRIEARLDLRRFVAQHGDEKCGAMFVVIKERDAKKRLAGEPRLA